MSSQYLRGCEPLPPTRVFAASLPVGRMTSLGFLEHGRARTRLQSAAPALRMKEAVSE